MLLYVMKGSTWGTLNTLENHFKGIARDPQRLLDFPRGCQRCPESHKDPQGKGSKEGNKNVECRCVYIYKYIASLRLKGVETKKIKKIDSAPLIAPP